MLRRLLMGIPRFGFSVSGLKVIRKAFIRVPEVRYRRASEV
jgi:hypothetical protein